MSSDIPKARWHRYCDIASQVLLFVMITSGVEMIELFRLSQNCQEKCKPPPNRWSTSTEGLDAVDGLGQSLRQMQCCNNSLFFELPSLPFNSLPPDPSISRMVGKACTFLLSINIERRAVSDAVCCESAPTKRTQILSMNLPYSSL